MIWVYVSGVCIAFSLTAVLTPLVRRLAFAVGAIDRPDRERKVHREPTPSIGGLAVACACFVTLVMLGFLFPGVETLPLGRLAVPSALILGIGLFDDVWSMRPRFKLLLQCVAAACFYGAGFRLERMFGMGLPVWVSLPATIVWLVACANVLNLFDGMDGLASGLGVVTALALLALSGYQGKVEVAVVSAVLAGAHLGFLLFNFPPAVIFLGDTGSLFLGMILGVLAVEGSFKSHLTFALVVPVIALGLPIMDTLLAIMRRVGRRVSVFQADKEHIHHRLVALGFTRRQALILLYALSILLASFSLLIAFSGSVLAGVLIVAGGVVIALVARFIGAGDVRQFGFFLLGGLGLRRGMARQGRVSGEAARGVGRTRVAFLTPLPTPYRQPMLERLADEAACDLAVYYFSEGEVDRGWEVRVPRDDGRFRILRGRSLAFRGGKSFINHWNPGLFGELDRGGFDVVVIPGYALLSSQVAIAWAWLRRKAYVIQSESHLEEPRSGLRRALKEVFVRRVVSRAAACLATGSWSRAYLCHYGARAERVFIFPNTPDIEWFKRRSDEGRAQRAALRERWGLPDGPMVLFAGRLIRVKGVDVLMRAFGGLREEVGEAQLVVVGDGPEEGRLRALARGLGMGDAVHFMGFQQRERLVELYACAEVFCLPSRREPWGVVVNEAAACGLPLVVSDRVGAGADLVMDGENGYVVACGDVSALRSALLSCLSDGRRGEAMGRRSREIVGAWGYDKGIEQFGRMLAQIARDAGGGCQR